MKKILGVLLVFCMVMALVPTLATVATASAPDYIKICNIQLDDGDYLASNEATEASENYTEGTSYVALYKDGVLKLNGINMVNNESGESDGESDHAIYWSLNYPGGADLVIELIEGTTNTLVDKKWSAINGAHGGGSTGPSVYIQGKGTLNVSGGSYGIWVWTDIVIQKGATVNVTGETQSGICNNTSAGSIIIGQGTNVTVSGGKYGVASDNSAEGKFVVMGGNLVVQGNDAVGNKIKEDFGGNTVYVSNNVSGEGSSEWDGTTQLKSYKYLSLSGFSNTVTTYDITKAATENGSITIDFEKSMADETVSITAVPCAGYETESIVVTDADGGNVAVTGNDNIRSFTMPAKNVTVSATFKQAESDAATTASVLYDASYNGKQYVGIMVETTEIPDSATAYGVEIDGTKYPATSSLIGGSFVVDIVNISADTAYTAKVYYTDGETVYKGNELSFRTSKATTQNAVGYYCFDGNNVGYSYKSRGIDVVGKDGNGAWIISTFSQGGWPMAYINTSTVYHDSPQAKKVADNKIHAWVVPEISNDGYFVKIHYIVRNITASAIEDFRFGSSADVMIGSQDRAPIAKTEYGLELSDGTNTFALLLNEGYTETPVSTKWFGYYSSASGNVYTEINSESMSGSDSGAAYSWQNITLSPGEVKRYEVILGVGDSETLNSLLKPSAEIDFRNELLTALEANESYKVICDDVTYELAADAEGKFALSGEDKNGTAYNFIGKTISLIEVKDGVESEAQEMAIAGRPVAEVPEYSIPGDNVPELPEDVEVETTENTITFEAENNQEYSIDGGSTWVEPTNGVVTFSGLTEGTVYTIQTRIGATDQAFASLAVSFDVKTAKMFTIEDVTIAGQSVVYSGEEQSLTATAEGATAEYALTLDGTYAATCPSYTNVGTYDIYYKLSKEGYHDYYNVTTLTILPKKINTEIELEAPVAKKAPVLTLETEEYTGLVTWSPAVADKFDYKTEYTATVSLTAKENYTVVGVGENEYTIEDAIVTNAPDSGVLTAKFEKTKAKPSSTVTASYYVTFDTNGGSEIDRQQLHRNNTVTKPADPEKEGYIFDGWYTDAALKTAYDFERGVTQGFTLYAKWVEAEKEHICPSEAFSDLDTTLWYHEDTDYVIENGLFKGVTETTFAPDDNLTRAMLVTVLYRQEGEPATNRSIPFADLDMGDYYASAVVWAQQNGIVKGISETEFAPNEYITREQVAAIMFRYAQYKGMEAVTMEENLHFADSDKISAYAISAMNWAVGAELIKGRTETTLNPLENITRVEIAAILHRFIEK